MARTIKVVATAIVTLTDEQVAAYEALHPFAPGSSLEEIIASESTAAWWGEFESGADLEVTFIDDGV